MENLTYQTYLDDPRVRERLDWEVRQMRAEAAHRYIGRPLMNLFRRVIRRPQIVTQLKRGDTMTFKRGRGTEVQVVDGNVWLTQLRDHRDYVMHPGDRVVLNGKGTTLIYAFADSSLRLAA